TLENLKTEARVYGRRRRQGHKTKSQVEEVEERHSFKVIHGQFGSRRGDGH
ncbi:hypothetical protein HispidOSU_007497, partial [Sigmodon hispidus]